MSEKSTLLLLDYWSKMQNSLLNIHYLEESLRMYLSSSTGVNLRNRERIFPYDFSYKDLKRDSIDSLLEKFQKINPNQRLIKKISTLKDYRSFCLNRGYLLPYAKQCHEKYLTRELDAMDKILKVSEECLDELVVERKRLQGLRRTGPPITRRTLPRTP